MPPAAPVVTTGPPRPTDRGVPVGLNEAALDSPTFRATASHFTDQIEAVEKWLHGYVSSTSKFAHEIQGLEDTINTYLTKTMPSTADGIIENDYTFLALKRVGDGQRECWQQLLSSVKRTDTTVIDPIRNFLSGDMRNFKEIRRILELSQRAYDTTLARYVSQSKTKEPSALREDAFTVYENRKAYIQASLDYCQLAPQIRLATDKLLVKVCNDIWKDLTRSRDAVMSATRWTREMDRVRGWAKEMEASEGVFRTELQAVRRELGETTLESIKPSRELEDYSASTVPFLGSRGPLNLRPKGGTAVTSEKQGWLFLRTISGKPVRYNWTRRWYYCRDGVFGWLVPGSQGVLQGDEIGVLLCNAKPAVGEERRFCFEVKTKNQTMMLQAEHQSELMGWLEIFEITKKKAFETSIGNNDNSVAGGTDPAFSIHPPSAPEFSAKAFDNQTAAVDDIGPGFDRNATLYVPGQDTHVGARHSVDVNNANLGRRSFSALGKDLAREDDESRRDHAARIIQKLDLHRKSPLGAGVDPPPPSPGMPNSGIASLISASHNLLPAHPGTQVSASTPKQPTGFLPSLDTPPGSLAPLTLAKPPATTSLSRAAVLLTAEKHSLSNSRKLPTSIVANYWGSNVWATINTPEQPVLPRRDDDDPIGVVLAQNSQTSLSGVDGDGHANHPLPRNYPSELRTQNAQFRLLFPNAPLGENLVLVFRAAWSSSKARDSPNDILAGDGRIFVSPDNMYFYSQQMGLVTAYSISLDIITEVTSAAGRDCDFIFLHLGQDTNDTGYTSITVKVFLDDLQLLHTRLNLLVDNLQAEEPMDTQDIISALLNVEKERFERPSPGAESWEDGSPNSPIDDGTSFGMPLTRSQHEYGSRLRQSRPPQGLAGKLHLPSRPVVYEPEGMTQMAAERHFEISAKACFHVLFGDKSFVFPKLYFEHRAQQIAQGPWLLVDEGQMRRDFHFKVDCVDMLGRKKSENVNDYQTIEVYSDHVTYVVTHIKTAWHLPHSGSFKLVTKIVITHVAKSKCKLAAYVKIDWSKTPALSKNLVERQALHDAIDDAEEMAELATDQVRKLGPRSRTNRAIQVYGHVGQQTQVIVFSPAAAESSKKQAIKPRTLTAMLFETVRSFGESAVSSLIMWAFAGLKTLYGIVTAHRIIVILLCLSSLMNLLLTSAESSTWWKERSAALFMRRVGVAPNPMMSKAIYFADLGEAAGAHGHDLNFPKNSSCFSTYKKLLESTEIDVSWDEADATLSSPSSRAAARRLRRTRQRLGAHRHDLMVAMRVVNSIEKEILQSEWENWLMNEKSLCDDLELVLREDGMNKDKDELSRGESSKQKLLGSLTGSRKKALQQWRDNYCGSCRQDFESVIRERIVTGV
ncbi:Pleckstrin-domain containing protein [Metarhizium rileyi]|uniref:Pleckstrin-domain containing protein n=1 Tax=Metarhizium rileyi (strain RCEF 4871) TaxID=1649241 RepID=A0A167E028_METRR|nr:Pleckstrin-domain containing protein [Metarhizium rileyi RCEF 4871]